MVWGNWNPIYLWLILFVALTIYALNKYSYGIDNLSDKKFKAFIICCILFVSYYFLVYDPVIHPVQRILLSIVNVMPHASFSVNANAFFGFIILLVCGMGLFFIVKVATKKAITYLPKKA